MPSHQHAVVIGGSMGGLLAARVLSSHFKKVTLIERDCFPATGEQRRGVPQGRHTHGLLSSGESVLAQLFPGIQADLIAAGAVGCDPVKDGYWFHQGAPLLQVESGIGGVLLSRPLLEGMVRERVLGLANLECLQDTVVDRLQASESGRVTGVRIGAKVIEADLVVDATGRGSHAPRWLEELGFEGPAEERVEIALGYATRLFRRREGELDGRSIAIIPPTPEGKRGGVAIAQEGGRWTVTLISHFQASPPLDLPGFIEYARTLPAPYVYDLVSKAEPIGDGIPARMPASIRRRYEKLSRFPEGFLVLGDAICSFNPIYGQGMSVSALEALTLDRVLGKGGGARQFFAEAARVVDIPWSIAVGNDLRMPETVGPRSAAVNFINWYVAKVHKAAHCDAACSIAFQRVANLLEEPPSLMKPAMLWRVLRANLIGGSAKQQRPRQSGAVAAI